MKRDRSQLHLQRFQLDQQLKEWRPVKGLVRPRTGWLKAVRESLGITARQMAALLGTDAASVLGAERREPDGKVTLETLDRAARAMGCRLVYAIVPEDDSLEDIVDRKAQEAAGRLVAPVEHSMRLEQQGVGESVAAYQERGLAGDLKSRLDPELWAKK